MPVFLWACLSTSSPPPHQIVVDFAAVPPLPSAADVALPARLAALPLAAWMLLPLILCFDAAAVDYNDVDYDVVPSVYCCRCCC